MAWIALEFSWSRFPEGSSARIMSGLLHSARAIATRCLSPPERSFTLKFALFVMPTISSRDVARLYEGEFFVVVLRLIFAGIRTFSMVV